MSAIDREYLDGYRAAARAAGDRAALAWGTMIYACPGCGWEHRVWMGVGVEGPPDLHAAKTYIPAPFYCGTCPRCRGHLHHDRWNEDEEWPQPREIPGDVARFLIPGPARARRLARRGYGGADYVDPTGRTR